MSRIRLVIVDTDTRYMENLAAYLMAYYRHRFSVQTFSDMEVFSAFVRRQDAAADIYLVAGALCVAPFKKPETGLTIALNGGEPCGIAGVHSVERYKSADALAGDILKIYSEYDGALSDAGLAVDACGGSVISVLSAGGGVGRTTAAIGLCAYYAGKGQRTLYLNLDWTGVETCAFDMEDGASGMSDIIFSLKTRPEKLGLRLEALRLLDSRGHFFFYAPPVYPMDVDELEPAEVELLVQKLRGLAIYDRILIDTHGGLSVRNKTLLEIADSALLVGEASQPGTARLARFKIQLDQCFAGFGDDYRKKWRVLLNKADEADEMDSSRLSERVREMSALFGSAALTAPYCAQIDGRYEADAAVLSGAGPFGTAMGAVARVLAQ